MAHTKSQKATRGNKESNARRLGVKLFGGQTAKVGNVIIRQNGTRFKPGIGTKLGRDYTIFAMKDGIVSFIKRKGRKYVTVTPPAITPQELAV